MTAELNGHVALVTGAGRGIGRGCAEALAGAGAKVIVVARSKKELDEVAAHSSNRIEPLQADVTDTGFADRVESIEGLSILVNNAGVNRPQPMIEVDDQSLDLVLDLNVRAAYRVARSAARSMVGNGVKGCIINMSSQMGHVGSPDRTVYCMTKHAIEGLTKAMAVELGPHGIRVNAVAPTFVETPMTKPMLEDADFYKFVLNKIPMGQLASIEQVAAAVIYLCSPGAATVTGHSLRVDGGWTAQ